MLRNDQVCSAYETVTLRGVAYRRICDGREGWWATAERYDKACEHHGDSQDYDAFVEMMGEADCDTADELNDILQRYYDGEHTLPVEPSGGKWEGIE